MSYYDLTDKTQAAEAEHRRQVYEATTMDAISFIPSHLGVVKAKLMKLARKKNKWGLEILEVADAREVRVEKELRITVPNEHWAEFQRIYMNEGGMSLDLDLTSLMDEAQNHELVELHRELKSSLFQTFNSPKFASVEQRHTIWYGRFGVDEYKSDNIAVRCEQETLDIEKRYGELITAYGDDRGTMEMMIENLLSGRAIAGEVFGDYDFIYGTVMVSNYTDIPEREKIHLVFESTLDPGFIHAESVYVGSGFILDELDKRVDNTKRVENVVYPANEVFDASFFGTLQRVVHDVQAKMGD